MLVPFFCSHLFLERFRQPQGNAGRLAEHCNSGNARSGCPFPQRDSVFSRFPLQLLFSSVPSREVSVPSFMVLVAESPPWDSKLGLSATTLSQPVL